MTARSLAVAAAVLLLANAAWAQTPAPGAESDHPEVRSLTLKGVRRVDKGGLLASIATDQSRCKGLLYRPFCLVSHSSRWWDIRRLDRVELRRDVLRIQVYYFERGYRNARVDTVVDRTGKDQVAVTFRIHEGPPTLVRTLRVVRPESLLADRRLRRLLLLRAGKPFSIVALDSSLVLLRQELWNRGYGDAVTDTATRVDTALRVADITIRADPRWRTTIGPIRVQGNTEVTTRTIENSLSFKEGQPFRRTEIMRSQRRLYESNLFRHATIRSLSRGDSVKTIAIEVAEAPHNVVRSTLGFNTYDFVQVEGVFTRYNFFGGARQLELRATLGNLLARQLNGSGIFRNVVRGVADADLFLQPTWQLGANFTQPWFLSPNNSLGLGAFAHRSTAPGVYVDRGYGATATMTREIAARTPISLNYRYEVTRVDAGDVYFCVSFGVCDAPTISTLRRTERLSPLLLTGRIDRTDNPFAPTTGVTAHLDLEHASAFTLSDYRYNRIFTEATYYRPVGAPRHVLAMHASVGWVVPLQSTLKATGALDVHGGRDILHPRKRFYAGGSRSVRGLGENQLGPRVLTIPPSKLRFCSGTPTGLPTAQQIRTCDLGSAIARDSLSDRDFEPRPLGGSSLLEGSVEYRFPLYEKLSGAVFLDGAFVGSSSLAQVASGAGALTPGIGVRYASPVGAIRVDVGFNPTLAENLPVVTQVDVNGTRQLITLDSRWRFDPARSTGGLTGLLRRFTLHLSIGEAY